MLKNLNLISSVIQPAVKNFLLLALLSSCKETRPHQPPPQETSDRATTHSSKQNDSQPRESGAAKPPTNQPTNQKNSKLAEQQETKNTVPTPMPRPPLTEPPTQGNLPPPPIPPAPPTKGASSLTPQEENQASHLSKQPQTIPDPAKKGPLTTPRPRKRTPHSLPTWCNGPTVSTLSAPIFPHDPAEGTYLYHFQRVKAKVQPAVTTLIIIPGGPGGTLMSKSLPQDLSYNFPENWDVIVTDPRGAGCNVADFTGVDNDALRSDYIAADILEMIRFFQLNHSIIYGGSYGTVVATYLADQLTRTPFSDPLQRPQAILLEGVVGKADASEEQSQAAFTRCLEAADPERCILQQTDAGWWGVSPVAWRQWFYGKTVEGNIYTYARGRLGWHSPLELLIDQLKKSYLSEIKKAKILEEIEVASEHFTDATSEEVDQTDRASISLGARSTYRTILCQELLSGRTTDHERDFCQNHEPSLLYDPAQLTADVPMIYFQGEKDCQTELTGARYHFDSLKKAKVAPATTVQDQENQNPAANHHHPPPTVQIVPSFPSVSPPSSERVFVEVAHEGHAPLGHQLAPCRKRILRSLLTQGHLLESLNQALGYCSQEEAEEEQFAHFVSFSISQRSWPL